jgi:hypothetical protein
MQLKTYLSKLVIGFTMLAMAGVSSAQNAIWCAGKIQHYFVTTAGFLYVFPDWRQDWIALCGTSSSFNGVDPIACRAMLSTVIAATTGKITTTIHFPSAPACSSVGTYSTTQPIWYVMLNNP